MERFDVHILGCGSAKPTLRHLPTAQLVNFREKYYLVDCGEGAQVALRRQRLDYRRIAHIFISHLHGDHCFGLLGLLSTLALDRREGEITVYAPAEAERVFRPMLDYFCNATPYTIRIAPFSTVRPEVLLDERSLRVTTIPLRHKVPTAGFLFEEKPGPRHLAPDRVQALGIPVAYYRVIKQGADWTDPATGLVTPNAALTTPPDPVRRYAFCSDTAYDERIIPLVAKADLLYHEATYTADLATLARARGHSTAAEAATIALRAGVKRLCIGHYSSRYTSLDAMLAEARAIFPATELADEGLCLHV